MNSPSFSDLCIGMESSIRQAAASIDRNARGIVLVVDGEQRLFNTITDGDLRRAILAGLMLDDPISELLARKSAVTPTPPVTAPVGTDPDALLYLMREHGVRQIPLLERDGCVVGLVTLDELVPDEVLPLQALIMAGGLGTRLLPLTEELPKPMLPVGTRPLLELIVEQLRLAGIRQVNLATHYKSELIADHFRDGSDFGVDIRYVKEDQPLGTAGALSMLEESEDPLLVMNGDILTRVDFRSMLHFHREHKADLTIAVREYEFRVPYGVIDTDGVQVRGISEKPLMRYFINAGIYLLNPSVCRMIPERQAYDIPELIERLLAEGHTVVSFPIREYWLDIGKTDHYSQAQTDVASGRF